MVRGHSQFSFKLKMLNPTSVGWHGCSPLKAWAVPVSFVECGNKYPVSQAVSLLSGTMQVNNGHPLAIPEQIFRTNFQIELTVNL